MKKRKPNEKQSIGVYVRFTPPEWKVISKRIKHSKMGNGEFGRYCVLEQIGYKTN